MEAPLIRSYLLPCSKKDEKNGYMKAHHESNKLNSIYIKTDGISVFFN